MTPPQANPKLTDAIAAGQVLNAERLANRREVAVKHRLAHLLQGDWVYQVIRDAVALDHKYAEIYPRLPDYCDEESAGWWCDAVNRIDGLHGVVKSDINPMSKVTLFYVHITWDTPPA